MLKVHEKGNDVICFYNCEHYEYGNQNIAGDRGEGNAYFENGDNQENPKGSPDYAYIFRIVVLFNELIVYITGMVPVLFLIVVMFAAVS